MWLAFFINKEGVMSVSYMLIHEFNNTGVPMAAKNLIKALDNNMKLIVIGELADVPNFIDATFLNVKRGRGIFGKARYLVQSIWRLYAYMKLNNVNDIVVWGKEFIAVCVIIRLFKKKLVISGIITTDMTKHLQGKYFRRSLTWIYKLLLSKVTLIAQSNGIATGLKNLALESTVIYPPIGMEFYNANFCDKKKKIVWVGKLTEYKQPEIALDVITSLSDYELVYIGEGNLLESLKKRVKILGVEKRVFFAGSQENVISFIQDAGVLILTSKFEGFGMVLAEAISLGVPAVSFDCPSGPSEIINDGENGYLVEYGNVELLKKKVEQALKTNFNKQQLRNSVSKFSAENVVSKYKDVLTDKG
jgi:glycosyltransferase involved in cell wall biosynthesis